jgi:cytochrome oxidase assembly protein ShyY1
MVWLGFWQLERQDEREATNADVESALAQDPIELDTVGELDDLAEYTHVEVTGTLDSTETVYKRYPIRNGLQGYEVLAPLRTPSGSVMVNQGWISLDDGRAKARPEFVAQVEQTVTGYVRRSEDQRGELGENDGSPAVPTVESIDRESLNPIVSGLEADSWIALDGASGSERAGNAEGPEPLELPSLDSGPHFSYALQWFSFAAIAAIGWALLCRRALP